MLPRLLEFGEYGLPTYGVLAAIGLILGLTINVRLAKREGLDPDTCWDLGILAILSGILGAKILYIANDWGRFAKNPWEIFSFETLQSGGVFYGGLFAAIAVSLWYMRRHRLPLLKTLDVFAPGVALGHAVGRLGCFAAGCCYGKPTDLPWGVTFTSELANRWVGTTLGEPIHPTQIYEFLVELANFGVLMWLFRRRSFDGQVIGAYLFLYGFTRYFLEFLRDDPGRGSVFHEMMTGTQLISILMVIAGGALWLRREREPRGASAAQARPS
ncbi:MAG: prolipoprotein diacylglyceryl transferase [Acidobacteria bacterium]|nr:prolipoprotein diacylglyceryl transferase [Acidobacteriota bacterium]